MSDWREAPRPTLGDILNESAIDLSSFLPENRYKARAEAAEAESARLREQLEAVKEALDRLGSMESMGHPFYIDKESNEGRELILRIEYARDKSTLASLT